MNIKISLILFVILISGCKSWNIQITRPGYNPGYNKQYPRLPHAFALVKNPHPVRYGEKVNDLRLGMVIVVMMIVEQKQDIDQRFL